MYVEIKDSKLISWCANPYKDYVEVDIDYSTFDPEKYSVIEGILTNISETEEYKTKVNEKEKEASLKDLKFQIEDLDKKRIRAIAEPSLKDGETGQTWLEYYTEQIQALRVQVNSL